MATNEEIFDIFHKGVWISHVDRTIILELMDLARKEGKKEKRVNDMIDIESTDVIDTTKIEKIPVKDRTEEEHKQLILKHGGFRNYLLSMGKFKDVPIENK